MEGESKQTSLKYHHYTADTVCGSIMYYLCKIKHFYVVALLIWNKWTFLHKMFRFHLIKTVWRLGRLHDRCPDQRQAAVCAPFHWEWPEYPGLLDLQPTGESLPLCGWWDSSLSVTSAPSSGETWNYSLYADTLQPTGFSLQRWEHTECARERYQPFWGGCFWH